MKRTPLTRKTPLRGQEVNRRGATVACDQCGQQVYKQKRSIERDEHHYCSHACMVAWRRDNGFPQVAGLIVNSADNKRHGRAVQHDNRPTRRAVIARDGDWCLFCGRSGPGLHLHRVVYGSQGGKYEPSNCVQLCLDHHALVHSSKVTWQHRLVAHIAAGGGQFRV
jgi:hypothetical protein